jgi:hypothetical protein
VYREKRASKNKNRERENERRNKKVVDDDRKVNYVFNIIMLFTTFRARRKDG